MPDMALASQTPTVSQAPAAPVLLQDLVAQTARHHPDQPALAHAGQALSYAELDQRITRAARGMAALLPAPGERVAVYLHKMPETVIAMFATAAAGGVFIPVNPVLKAEQVRHILRDSGARVLVTSAGRLEALADILAECPALEHVLLVDAPANAASPAAAGSRPGMRPFAELLEGGDTQPWRRIDADLAAIFYTSGSTGNPKGVMLSHRNLVAGGISVASYIGNHPQDRVLSVLPLSFDAGFSQLTTAFVSGACVVLLDYLLPRDVIKTVARERITGITGVPPLWSQLAELDWPAETGGQLRYFATTGGVMPRALLDKLRLCFPNAKPFLMYGLTEAFRSTFLPPEEVERRPDSIGKAIPNAEILVLHEDGTPCAPGEPGELVHRGALVALGYWNAPEVTAQRFKPVPGMTGPGGQPEIAVWSGDTVVKDEEGFLYFRGRRDEMIKTSGYRVSPTEIEDMIMGSGLVREVVALGLPDLKLGQRILVIATSTNSQQDSSALLRYCREKLPFYMLPTEVIWREQLPRNANGKFDRVALRKELDGAVA